MVSYRKQQNTDATLQQHPALWTCRHANHHKATEVSTTVKAQFAHISHVKLSDRVMCAATNVLKKNSICGQ